MKSFLLHGCAVAIVIFCCCHLSGMGQTRNRKLVHYVQPETRSLTIAHAQDSIQSLIKKYYDLAMRYKNGDGVALDYITAFNYFSKAAALGDPQSSYGVAYMKYKGLGTKQDYSRAASLFRQGAYEGRDNSMYFYGLCWRNGYGISRNEDSAQYWLKKAALMGYKQAILELQSNYPENSNVMAVQLMKKIKNAALPERLPLNQFISIQPQEPEFDILEGDYEGYLIQYDWGGKTPVVTKKLRLILQKSKDQRCFKGKWLEENTDAISLKASLKRDSLVFEETYYRRKDHYSQDKGIEYDFQNASLNLVRRGDSVYLAGNVYMFSPDRKEPSKPLLVALVRTADSNLDSTKTGLFPKYSRDTSSHVAAVKQVNVYPNPFINYLNISFEVTEKSKVGIELNNILGQKVYVKTSQLLNKGAYKIRLELSQLRTSQIYILRLIFDNGEETLKLIKK